MKPCGRCTIEEMRTFHLGVIVFLVNHIIKIVSLEK
jgi:hypothetical protein